MKKLLLSLATLTLCANADAQMSETKSDNEIIIKNSKIALKQDLTRGGAINYISLTDQDRNIVNIHDEGRYIQQSYYAGQVVNRKAEGQSPTWSPWTWNPIQVGDYAANRAEILEYKNEKNKSYVKCIPMLWDMNNHPAEAVMEQWVELKGSVVKVHNRITCHRTDSIYGEGIEREQEIPAVYFISALKNLHSYFGSKPFSGEPAEQTEVKQIIVGDPEHPWGSYDNVPEQWMAFTDDNGWGAAVYSPSATHFMAGRFDDNLEGHANSPATSYIAPLRNEIMMKNSVVEYEYYIIVGTLEQIRKEIYKIQRKNR